MTAGMLRVRQYFPSTFRGGGGSRFNWEFLVRPEGLEPPTLWFEARCSIQLSYGRTGDAGGNYVLLVEL